MGIGKKWGGNLHNALLKVTEFEFNYGIIIKTMKKLLLICCEKRLFFIKKYGRILQK